MANIYSNALLTIAASDGVDCSVGFLRNYISHFPVAELEGRDGAKIAIEYALPNQEETISFGWESRLSRRSWALQERLLAPRTLFFRQSRMIWECFHHCLSDDKYHSFTLDRINYNEVKKRRIESINDANGIFAYWYDIAETYSKCELSQITDKLPALSGLAHRFSHLLQDRYVAGIWHGDFHAGLSWLTTHCYERIINSVTCSDPGRTLSSHQAPSWSWLSAGCRVSFDHETRAAQRDLVIISASVLQSGNDPFGRVGRGNLKVNGRLRRGFIGLNPKKHNLYDHYIYNPSGEFHHIGHLTVDCSRIASLRTTDHEERREVLALLLAERLKGDRWWIAIALEPVCGGENDGKYIRIGLITCGRDYEAGHDWFDKCERQVMEII
jgi:hypothetical protein